MRILAFLFLLTTMSLTVNAQSKDAPFKIPNIPGELQWQNLPVDWKFENNILSITAGEKTDLFIDPATARPLQILLRLFLSRILIFCFKAKFR